MSGHWSGEDPGTGFAWLLGLAIFLALLAVLVLFRVVL